MRYLLVLAVGWLVILVLAAAFFFLTPKSYDSGFTIILPGAGQSSSVNLATLGQSESRADSPFGSHSLSPTENYKRLLQSYRLRGGVAERLGLSMDEVPAPKVQLANQTKLMFVSVRSSSPEAVQELAENWLVVFEEQLSALRTEEQVIREGSYRATLASFEEAVELSRARIIAFQTKYGLISLEQFQELVAQTETMRLSLDQSDAEMRVAQSETSRLATLMDMSADNASDVMTLLSDQSFQALNQARSMAATKRAELIDIFGENHPDLIAATEEHAGLQASMRSRGNLLLGYKGFASIDESYYSSNNERAALISKLMQGSVRLSGSMQSRQSRAEQLAASLERVEYLAGPATELDALLRDHQVAETVFASALARLDANRTDIFASYPLTQTVETPGLPTSPATPSKKFIALGTIAGIMFYSIGLALLWIRLPIIRALLKTL